MENLELTEVEFNEFEMANKVAPSTQIVIPFRYGRGKTGNAQTGDKRALIVETEFYPDAFWNLKFAIRQTTGQFSNPTEAFNKAMKWLLTEGTSNENAHVQEIEFGKYNLVFINLPLLSSGHNQYLAGITINGEHIKLK
jgi:hypothetical protein